MATVSYHLDTRREKKDGTYPIKLHSQTQKPNNVISTDFCATPENVDGHRV